MPTDRTLSTTGGVALYVGALLGPSLLLLPGLAAELAGPASIVAWSGLLALSAMLARVFTALGTRLPTGGGVVAYVGAGLGVRAGRAAGWCFVAGVVLGAPVVCLIGGGYLAVLLGGGRGATIGSAAVLLAVVIALTLGGARASATAQLVLVVILIVLVVVAVTGTAHAVTWTNWTPFTPHGWASVGRAASVLMLSFVGWEAIAPLTSRFRNPARQLPRVIGAALAITTILYLALAFSTVAVLGARSTGAVPLSDLLRIAVGAAGPAIAAVAAVALTLAATNAYISGAAAMILAVANSGPRPTSRRDPRTLQLGIGTAGFGILATAALGIVDTATMVALPTTFFLVVYLGCTGAAIRILRGHVRVLAAASCIVVGAVLAFAGWSLVVAIAVTALGVVGPARSARVIVT
jgi:amino acid efflux transporter